MPVSLVDFLSKQTESKARDFKPQEVANMLWLNGVSKHHLLNSTLYVSITIGYASVSVSRTLAAYYYFFYILALTLTFLTLTQALTLALMLTFSARNVKKSTSAFLKDANILVPS